MSCIAEHFKDESAKVEDVPRQPFKIIRDEENKVIPFPVRKNEDKD